MHDNACNNKTITIGFLSLGVWNTNNVNHQVSIVHYCTPAHNVLSAHPHHFSLASDFPVKRLVLVYLLVFCPQFLALLPGGWRWMCSTPRPSRWCGALWHRVNSTARSVATRSTMCAWRTESPAACRLSKTSCWPTPRYNHRCCVHSTCCSVSGGQTVRSGVPGLSMFYHLINPALPGWGVQCRFRAGTPPCIVRCFVLFVIFTLSK